MASTVEKQRPMNLDEFFLRFPCDSRAKDYLSASSVGVIERALKEFHPQREGEKDYSALLVTFVRGLRHADLATRLGSGEDGEPGGQVPVNIELLEEIERFKQKFPLDEAAHNYLMNSATEVQWAVLQDFNPPRQGEADYSALLISFTKRCRQNNFQQQHQHQMMSATMGQKGGHMMHNGNNVPAISAHALRAELKTFAERYPMDEEALNYLMNSSPDVQVQVLQDFHPPREGEGDYSALVISFSKRCRQSAFERVAQAARMQHHFQPAFAPRGLAYGGRPPFHQGGFPALHHQAHQPHQPHQPQQLYQRPQAPPFQQYPSFNGNADELLELQDFRRRFPMDERAYGYLAESSPAVRRQVFDTFAPKRLDDTDFSAPVVAYAKLCRARVFESAAHGSHFMAVAPPRFPAPMQARMPVFRPAVQPVTDAQIGEFCRRYPMDGRALELMLASPPAVVARVLREFRPKREGEADYSAAVVAFVGVCKRDAFGGSVRPFGGGCAGYGGCGGFVVGPPKRPRLF